MPQHAIASNNLGLTLPPVPALFVDGPIPLDESGDLSSAVGPTEREDPRPLTILWVDDEPSVIDSSRNRLAQDHISVVAAHSPSIALKLLETQRWDVIILDYRLPGMSGIELLAVLRCQGITTPVMILTSHGTQNVEYLADQLGGTTYYEKPLPGHQLTAAIRGTHRAGGSVPWPSLPGSEVPMDGQIRLEAFRHLRELFHRLETLEGQRVDVGGKIDALREDGSAPAPDDQSKTGRESRTWKPRTPSRPD